MHVHVYVYVPMPVPVAVCVCVYMCVYVCVCFHFQPIFLMGYCVMLTKNVMTPSVRVTGTIFFSFLL